MPQPTLLAARAGLFGLIGCFSVECFGAVDVAASGDDFKFGRVTFAVEKNDESFHYWLPTIPDDERAFTHEERAFGHEIRRFDMPGMVYAKPIVITPSNASELPPYLRLFSAHLALARKGDSRGIIRLFDTEDQAKIRNGFTAEEIHRGVTGMALIDEYEIHLIVRDGPYTFAFGYAYRGKDKSRTVLSLKETAGKYYLAGGLPSVTTNWEGLLGFVLMKEGFEGVHNVKQPTK